MASEDTHIYKNWEAAAGEIVDIISNQKVIFTNGCYDILHPGHYSTLEKSKALGDILIVGLNSDTSITRLKGSSRPINRWGMRASALYTLKDVDMVIGFDEDTPLELITALRPDVITKGGDYNIDEMIGAEVVHGYGGEVILLPYLDGHSTTGIIYNS